MKKVVLASSNIGKIRELTELLKHTPIDLIPQSSLHIPDSDETGLSFIENAILKARHASRLTRLPAIADDSGLCVPALSDAPGVYSARYAGKQATAADNIKKLLHEMENMADENRKAYFQCVLVFLAHPNDPTPIVCSSRWEGLLLREARGHEGFGYDPIFYVPSCQQTAAELAPEIKNKISHRGMAMQTLLTALKGIV